MFPRGVWFGALGMEISAKREEEKRDSTDLAVEAQPPSFLTLLLEHGFVLVVDADLQKSSRNTRINVSGRGDAGGSQRERDASNSVETDHVDSGNVEGLRSKHQSRPCVEKLYARWRADDGGRGAD